MGKIRRHVNTVQMIGDGSTDATAELARVQSARVRRRAVNRGYARVIEKGFELGSEKIVVRLDAAGEHTPGAIPDLVTPVRAGRADLVQARNPAPQRAPHNLARDPGAARGR